MAAPAPTATALPGIRLRDHWIDVPLDHAAPGGETLRLYGREVVAPGGELRPWLLFLQGGPGGKSHRPHGPDAWLARALADHRVLLLDQRGTGRSAPVTPAVLAARGGVRAQADYLARFRADSIVADAELLRRSLIGDEPWSVLGQSFGGFCALTYLSFAPEGLRAVAITGGLAGLEASAEEVYRRTYARIRGKNERYYARYPADLDLARQLMDLVRDNEIKLPGGAVLSPQRVQTLGYGFGASTGFEVVHYLLEEALDSTGSLTPTFLAGVSAGFGLATAPLYGLLHEACYAQGTATDWAAQRVRSEFPDFDADAGRVLFTGEMIYPWMFAEDPALRPYAAVAEALATRTGWPRLYDPDQLARNEIPVAAAIYHDDAYVDADYSLDTAGRVAGLRPWVTNEFEHDGLRVAGDRVLGRLLDLLAGRA